EPKASLPDKFDGTRRNFRGFINQLELVFQLQASRYDTDRKKIAMLGTLLNGNALSWYNPYLEKPDIFQYDLSTWPRFKEKFRATFGEVNQEQVSESRLLSAAMDLAIRIDNRLFERRQEQRLSFQRPSFGYAPETPATSHFRNQQQQQRLFEPRQTANPSQSNSFINSPSARPIRKSDNHMDIDFVRRGPLSSMEQHHRMKQGLCFVCGKAGHRKTTCSKSRFNSNSLRNIQAIQTEFMKQQDSRKPNRLSSKKQLSSARQPSNFDNLNGYDENC
ncbi:hypothetical protein BASA81_018138, partial [Batrachochytrium salamandrivorans]